MLNMVWVNLKAYKEAMPMVVVMTVMALALISIFGNGFNGSYQPKVAIVDSVKSSYSIEYKEQLSNIDGFKFEEITLDEGLKAVEEGKVIAMIHILADSENEVAVSMYKAGDALEHQTLRMAIENVGRLYSLNDGFVQGMMEAKKQLQLEGDASVLHKKVISKRELYPILSLDVTTYDEGIVSGYDAMKHTFMGYILFFSMFTMVFGVGAIVENKENRVWHRQKVSPIKAWQMLLGNLIAVFIVSMLQLGFMILFSHFVFGIDFGGNILAFLLVLGVYVVAVMGLGLLLSGLVKTSQQLGAFSPVILVGSSMLGGCMWPLSIIKSKVLLFLADLMPQRWAYLGLKSIMVNNGGFNDVLYPIAMLLIITVILFGIAMIPYSKAQKSLN